MLFRIDSAGAIRAGTSILLRRTGLEPSDLGAVLLAGAFGNFIRRSNARRIGLLPQIPCERVRFVGNAKLGDTRLSTQVGLVVGEPVDRFAIRQGRDAIIATYREAGYGDVVVT